MKYKEKEIHLSRISVGKRTSSNNLSINIKFHLSNFQLVVIKYITFLYNLKTCLYTLSINFILTNDMPFKKYLNVSYDMKYL